MKTTTLLRIATPVVGLGLALSACSSSGSSSASGGTSTTAAAGSAGASSTTAGGSGTGSGTASGADLCSTVSAEKASTILGQPVTAAKALSASDRFRSSNTLPGCKYLGAPTAAGDALLVNAERLPCPDAEGVFTDTTVTRKDLAGVGDKAAARPDMVDASLYIDTVSKKGDECLYVRIYQGAPEAKAKALSNAFWGA